MFNLEVSIYNIEGVKQALKQGVHRLEICDNIKEGGTTPSAGFIKAALATGHPDVCVIIRPRGGDFLYSDDEFEIIKNDIIQAKELGVHGVVCGILNADGSVDIKRTEELVKLAKPMRFTFHRAFDMTNDVYQSLEDLICAGVDTVLTSGTENTALEGTEVLHDIVLQAAGRITILVGSGVNAKNIVQLHSETSAIEFHMSAAKEVASEMKYFNRKLHMGNIESEEYSKLTVDERKIEEAIKVINYLNNNHA